jgi:hypothetical protein
MKVYSVQFIRKSVLGREVHTAYLQAENQKAARTAMQLLLPRLYGQADAINISEHTDTVITLTCELRK